MSPTPMTVTRAVIRMSDEAYTTGFCTNGGAYVLAVKDKNGATCPVCGSEVETATPKIEGRL